MCHITEHSDNKTVANATAEIKIYKSIHIKFTRISPTFLITQNLRSRLESE